MSPAGGGVNGLPSVIVFEVGGGVLVQQEFHHRQVAVGRRHVQRRGADVIPRLESLAFRRHFLTRQTAAAAAAAAAAATTTTTTTTRSTTATTSVSGVVWGVF